MFETKQTGVVRKNHEEAEFEFQIIDIFSIAEDECAFFKSPSFSFADALWHFELNHKPTFQPEFMKLGLTVDDPLKYKVEYQFGLKNIDGSLENLARGVLKDDDEWSDYCSFKLSDVQQRQSELAPSDTVTIKCMLKLARNQQDLSDEPKRKKQKSKS